MATGRTPKRAEAAPRRRLWLLTALLAALTLALAAPAAFASGDSTAAAVNEKDGSTLFDFAFSIRRAGGEVVDDTNAAVAYASCESCQTVALALQVVLVLSEPDVITPTNLAIAINENCTTCTTAALAYQYVIGTGGPVRFTAEGNRRIAAIRRELEELRRSGLSLEELLPRIDALRAELAAILATELVRGGRA
jgi:putative peptide zinc metalloprotease protein